MAKRQTSWTEVAGLLAPSRNYWLISVGRDGSPHTAPVWGAVVAENLYLYTERTSVKARNLAADPRAVVHLESGDDDVVIVHGRAEDLGHPRSHPAVVAAFDAKYQAAEDLEYLPSADEASDALYVVRPGRALLWEYSGGEESERRWFAV